MGLFDSFLGGNSESLLGNVASGFFGSDNLKDYAHASKLMRTDAFALAPNYKFLFHVYFTLNVPGPSDDTGLVGALVKSVALPAFNLGTEEYIQYNRKRLVHNKIDYQPVDIKFHDDSSDTVRSMWYNYYQYYFADATYPYDAPTNANGPSGNGIGYNKRDIYDTARPRPEWGKTTASAGGAIKPAFFKDIKIYGMSRKNFVCYTLVNPMITSWQHDTYDYAATNGTMEHTMQVKYEAVKYSRGNVVNGKPEGFGNSSRYDTSPSPLSSRGATASILGESGAVDTGLGIFEDLSSGNIFGAIKKGGTFGTTIKNADLNFGQILTTDLLNEAKKQAPIVLKALSKQPGAVYPKAGSDQTPKTPSTPTKPRDYSYMTNTTGVNRDGFEGS